MLSEIEQKTSAGANMPRLQIDVTDNKVKTMEKLMEACGFSTKKDLFNNALTLFQWAVNEKSQGNAIASINADHTNYRELQMPALNDVKVVDQTRAPANYRSAG
jgi:hypothetical protein